MLNQREIILIKKYKITRLLKYIFHRLKSINRRKHLETKSLPTNFDFLIPIILQPNDQIFQVLNIKGSHHQVAKILRLENLNFKAKVQFLCSYIFKIIEKNIS